MDRKWHSSKRFIGVHWRETARGGKSFYITYQLAGKVVNERIGSEGEGYSATLASEIRATRIQEVRHGLTRKEHKKPFFKELAESYLEWAEHHKKTANADRHYINAHMLPRFGSMLAENIRPLDLERMQRELAATGLAPASVRHVLWCFRRVWNKALEWGLLKAENPIQKVRLPKVDNARERALTSEEARSLLAALKKRSPVSYGLSLVSYNTGARLGELFNLRWADVDLHGKNVIWRNTKNGRTRRIPINDTVAAYLEEVRGDSRGEYVFSQDDGSRLGDLSSAFRRCADEMFNPEGTDARHRVVFHTLRHSFISDLVAKGVSLRIVQELVGHASLSMLQRYSHLTPGALRDAVQLAGGGPAKTQKEGGGESSAE